MLRRGLLAAALGKGLCLWLALSVFGLAPAQALDPLPKPTGPVLLTISGNIAVTNSEHGADFDRDMLYAFGLIEVHTNTAWTDGVQSFEGVLLRQVLERVGATGTTLIASALNDFVAPVPMEEVQNFDVILAAKRNGEEMTVSDRGPLWIVYPRDDNAELQDPRFNDRWVWQLREINVQ